MDYTEDGLTDPGYVRTPPMDISRHPVIRFSAKVRNPNPDNSGFLYYFMTNDTPELSYPYVMNALPISEEWTEVAFDTYAPLEYARIMLYYTAGNILVDDVCIEELIYPLDVVTNMSARVVSGNEIEVSFDPVEGASSYIVSTYSRRYDENVRNTVETSETTVIVPGNYIPDNYITVEVIAKNNTGESYPNNSLGLYFRVDDIDTPEAFDATDVSPNGFTANWKPSNFAVTQQLSLYLTHTVSEEKEELILIDEDFSEIPYSADDNEATISSFNGEPASLDHILNCKGWGFFMGEAIEGSISINNAWEEWGLPGLLTGPVGDYSFAGGKAFVSAKLNSTAEDVVLAVGFGNVKLGLNSLDITMNEGFAEIEISPESSVFDVEISGGDKDSRLMFMITDSREGGDKVIFDNLKITSYPQCGETYTILYDAPLFGHSDNSYKVDVDFTKNDTFEYYTTSSFGNISKESNKIIVYPENSGIGQMQENEAEEIKIYTLDGRRVETCDNLPKGIYIIHQNGKTYKIVR